MCHLIGSGRRGAAHFATSLAAQQRGAVGLSVCFEIETNGEDVHESTLAPSTHRRLSDNDYVDSFLICSMSSWDSR